ncbi:MAG: GC-type dockerin domain-anchored protein [Planctomycetota bacterium]
MFSMRTATTVATAAGLAISTAAVGQTTTFNGQGGTNIFGVATNWSAGVPTSATLAVIDGDTNVNRAIVLNSNESVRGLVINAGDQLSFVNGFDLNVFGDGIFNNNLIQFFADPAVGGTTILNFVGDNTISGTGGVLNIGFDSASNTFITSTNAVLTHEAGHTILGGGTILNNSGGLINNGRIRAESANFPIVINPGVQGVVNSGLIEGVGGRVILADGLFVNTMTANPMLAQGNEGSIFVSTNTTIRGGELLTLGGGLIITDNGSRLEDLSVRPGSVIRHEGPDDVSIQNLTLNGTWDMNPNQNLGSTVLSFVGPAEQTLAGLNGVLQMSDTVSNIVQATNITLTLPSSMTIRGGGTLLNNSGGLRNAGVIEATAGTTRLFINPGIQSFNNFANSSNGTLRALGAAGLRLGDGVYNLGTSEIFVADGSRLNIDTNVTINNGSLRTQNTGVVLPANAVTFNGVTLTGGSQIRHLGPNDTTILGGFVNNGLYDLNPNQNAGASVISFTGSQTISGSGRLVMGDSSSTIVQTTNSILTNAAGHEIVGAGTLINNSGGVVNNGTIRAVGANRLIINPGIQNFVNNNVLEAVGVGGINLADGNYFLNQPLRVRTGSRLLTNANTVLFDGTLIAEGTGQIEFDNATTLDNIALVSDADVLHFGPDDVTIRNGLTLEAPYSLNPNANTGGSILNISGSQEISGSGMITMGDSTGSIIQTVNSTLTVGENIAIMGSGTIVQNSGSLINNGTIMATGDTRLLIDTGVPATINNGVLEAVGAGGLRLGAGTYRLNQPLVVRDGSRLVTEANAILENGTLRTEGTGRARFLNATTLSGMTIDAGSVIDHLGPDDVTIQNDLIQNGTYRLNPNNNTGASVLSVSGSQSILGSGTIEMGDSTGSLILTTNSTLTLGPNATIRGAGDIMQNSGNLINNGTIIADGATRLQLDTGSGTTVNNNVLEASGPGGIVLGAGVYVFASPATIKSGSRMTLLTSARLQNGTLDGEPGSTVFALNGSILDNMVLAEGTTVSTVNAADVNVTQGLLNNGLLLIDGNPEVGGSNVLISSGNQSFGGTGVVQFSDDFANNILQSVNAVLTNLPGHTISGAFNLLQNSGGFVNQGRLLAIGESGPIRIDAGSQGFNNAPGGVMGGSSGFQFADGPFTNNGIIRPGVASQIASLTLTGDVSNSMTAESRFRVSGSSVAALDVTGTYTAGGEIDVRTVSQEEEDPMATFVVVSAAGGVSGFYSNAVPDAMGFARDVTVPGFQFDVLYQPNSISVTNIRAFVEPPSLDFDMNGVVNISDLFAFITAFTMVPPDPRTDFDQNGVVNISDLFAYIGAFTALP